MRKLILFATAMMTAASLCAQVTFTRARADQVKVVTNGMQYAVYPSLQQDVQALDTNMFRLFGVALDPTDLSNLVTSATANAVFDLMYSFPQMKDPSVVPALFPTGSTLNVSNLYVPGNVTSASVTANNLLLVGTTPIYGTVDSTVAITINPTNLATVCTTNQWLFRVVSSNTYQTADCVATNGKLMNLTAGIYSVAFNATLPISTNSTNWTVWAETALSSGAVLTNYCTPLTVLAGTPTSTVYSVNYSYPMSPGGTIRALATCLPIRTNSVTIVGGGVLAVSKTQLRDSSGSVITSLPAGGW